MDNHETESTPRLTSRVDMCKCDTPSAVSSHCSVSGEKSDEEEHVLPVIRGKHLKQHWTPSNQYNVTMTTRNTSSRSKSRKERNRYESQLSDVVQSSNNDLSKNSQCHADNVHLPHLKDTARGRDGRRSHRNETESDELRFPEISVTKLNGRLALNKSITDLLDPEIEILNKIKHTPRKKKRKRQKKTYVHERLLIQQDSNTGLEESVCEQEH